LLISKNWNREPNKGRYKDIQMGNGIMKNNENSIIDAEIQIGNNKIEMAQIEENGVENRAAEKEKESEKIANSYQDSPINSEFQRIINKLDSLKNGSGKQVILVTSAVMGEGKSTIALQLAIAAARNLTLPTLLIDTDLRHPTQHKFFDINPNVGLTDCLEGNLPLELCLNNWHRNNVRTSNFKLLTSGALNTNPLELITLEKMKLLFEDVRKKFDIIIVDAAPIIPVSDPLILGRLADTVLLVVKVGATPKKLVTRAIQMMKKVNIDIHGLVLNNVEDVMPHYYNDKFYQYSYYTNNSR